MSVFILVYGSKVGCQFRKGKILPISFTWQDSAKFMKLAAEHNFGRRDDGTCGKHTETLKNGSRTRLCQNKFRPGSILFQNIFPTYSCAMDTDSQTGGA
jgi:hypothetical protein